MTGAFDFRVMTAEDTPHEVLDSEALAIYQMFADRAQEFGFGPDVVIDYPPVDDPQTSSFLADPVAYIGTRLTQLADKGPIRRIVVLTTFGDRLLNPLAAAGYAPDPIDMPAGPDQTYAFTLDHDLPAGVGRTLYLEAVNEADEKIRPTFVVKLVDGSGKFCGGACGSIHDRDGTRFAYLATLTIRADLPPLTGTHLAEAVFKVLRRQKVATVHLGTQTASRFYERLGFRVTHRLVHGLRTRVSQDGRQLSDDLVMLAMDL